MNMGLAGLIMLIIGDSHIAGYGKFNNPLHDGLVNQGAVVHSFGICGAVPSDYLTPHPITCGRGERHNAERAQISMDRKLNGWGLAALITRYNPNVVVVELGENLSEYGLAPQLPRDWINTEVTPLVQTIKAANLPCIWIGPTWGQENGPWKKTFARVKELSDYLSQIVAPCHYVNSLAFSKPGEWPTLDGVHLTPNSTQLWDNHLVSAIDQIAPTLPHRPETASAGPQITAKP